MLRKIIPSVLTVAVVFIFMGAGLAKEEKSKGQIGPKRTSVKKELQGEVTWISKTGDRIAIVYNRDEASRSEQEILLPIDKNTVLQHKKNLDEIKAGDTVSIQYEEVTEETPEGIKSKRMAKTIYFIRAAQKKPVSAAPPASTQDSAEEEQE